MNIKKCWFLSLCIILSVSNTQTTDSLKGVWSDIKKFPPFHSQFWQGLAQGFRCKSVRVCVQFYFVQ